METALEDDTEDFSLLHDTNSSSDVVEEQAPQGQSNEVQATSKDQKKSDSASTEPQNKQIEQKSDSASSESQNKQMEQGAEPEKTEEQIIPEESKETIVEDDAMGSSLLVGTNPSSVVVEEQAPQGQANEVQATQKNQKKSVTARSQAKNKPVTGSKKKAGQQCYECKERFTRNLKLFKSGQQFVIDKQKNWYCGICSAPIRERMQKSNLKF